MLSWSLLVASMRKDLLRRFRDPFALFLWVGIPLVIGGLIVLAMGGSNGPAPRAKVLVVDHDDSLVSRLLISAMSSEQAKVITAEKFADEDDARRRINSGEGTALLVIPAGFGDAVLQERPMKLEVLTNPAQRILPAIVSSFLSILSEGSFYLHRVLGDEVRQIAQNASNGDGFEDLRVAEASVRIRHDIERIAPLVFPPAISVETVIESDDGPPKPSRSLASLYFPSTLLMALMFMAEGLADDVWRERTLGVLRRVAIAPLGAASVILGKLCAGWVLMLGTTLIGLVISVFAYDVEPVRVLPAALWASFAGAVLFALMTVIKLFSSSQRAAGLIGNLLLFPMIMVGGSLIPFEGMPDWLATIGRWTPNGWSMEVLKRMIYGAPRPLEIAAAFAGMTLVGALLVSVSALRMRSFARNEA